MARIAIAVERSPPRAACGILQLAHRTKTSAAMRHKIEDATDDHSATHLCARDRGRIDHDIAGAGAALAVAAGRRARDGKHARADDLAALRNLSCRSQSQVLRALLLALEHHAAIAVRRAAAGKI